jgi:hypothetical protein
MDEERPPAVDVGPQLAPPPRRMAESPGQRAAQGVQDRAAARSRYRRMIGIVLAVALVLIAIATITSASGETASGDSPSAIQLSQVYIEGCFYAIIAIGVAFGAYVFTRAMD